MRIVFVSTYPPIECGIGTYTSFLVEALERTPSELHIVSQYGALKADMFTRLTILMTMA